ncbi:MAG TPA: hypothetical protein VHE30_02955, partial [Polyangiaceae bacterium]|nr:hypothetical protein [Polyangiaceae bacterium]
YWNPPKTGEVPTADPLSPDAEVPVPAGCDETPPFDPALTVSVAGGASHLSGKPCLEGCHQEGGEAKTVFVAGGTVYLSQTSRETASSGEVHNVGGATLTVDRCGNIYAALGSIARDPKLTQPYVLRPTYHLMDKSLLHQKNPGSCNQSNCHDFGPSRLRWGVYF